MKLLTLNAILVGTLLLIARAEPDPAPQSQSTKDRVSAFFNVPANLKFRPVLSDNIDNDDDLAAVDDDENEDTNPIPVKSNPSKGRLFFNKLFGNKNQQPVIPIIITGTGGGNINGGTTTITTTGTIPSASGTITTSPVGSRTDGGYMNENEEEPAAEEAAAAAEEQALHEALAAGAQQYVVTDAEVKGTGDSKLDAKPNYVNLRRKGTGKKGEVISVRIPPQYRRYFKKGQRVMLNTGNRPGQRRVVKRRGNRIRRNRNRRNRNRMGSA